MARVIKYVPGACGVGSGQGCKHEFLREILSIFRKRNAPGEDIVGRRNGETLASAGELLAGPRGENKIGGKKSGKEVGKKGGNKW